MSSYFFSDISKNSLNQDFLDKVQNFAESTKKQVYVLRGPLIDSKYKYTYSDAAVLLVPKTKLCFVNFGTDHDAFTEYVEDLLEDLGSISDKFKYKDHIGRPRKWKDRLVQEVADYQTNFDAFDWVSRNALETPGEQRLCELIISLLTGSINNIDQVGLEVPTTLLDKIKRKIILFDGDQTRFIYKRFVDRKPVVIQGLSGTGKTELLLHKLKDIFVTEKSPRILFTCHNKILADSLRRRIPEFFNFMRVEEQILWNETLWCVSAWGSAADANSGAYRAICKQYDIPFLSFAELPSFKDVCAEAIKHLETKPHPDVPHAFTHVFVDESQDFPEEFIRLLEMVTEKQVFVAGDIFQSIFDEKPKQSVEPEIVLSKCYRTDPKTLMFAHAVGMGLFETDKLRWLEDEDWRDCGYTVETQDKTLILSREPLRRFEDLQESGFAATSMQMNPDRKPSTVAESIIDKIREIREHNPSCGPDDIGIIFVDTGNSTYATADLLEVRIPEVFEWKINKAWETKTRTPGKLLVSNKNNVKGLEFPFVVCITSNLNNGFGYRNALYTMLTRSFLQSYLLVFGSNNDDTFAILQNGLQSILKTGKMSIIEPTAKEKEKIRTRFIREKKAAAINLYDLVYGVFDELDIPIEQRKRIFDSFVTAEIDASDRDALVQAVKSMRQLMGPFQNDLFS